jgi:hypothetical protein
MSVRIKEEWRIEIFVHENEPEKELFSFRRYVNGNPIESYPPVSKIEAILYASSVISGFEPPRKLTHFHTPFR